MKMGYVLSYKLLILLLLWPCLGEMAQAQITESETSFVVTVGGDTLYGALKPLGKRRRSLAIRFRQRGADMFVEYTPDDFNVYVLDDGTRYESHQIAESRGVRHRFLQLLVDGYTKLYYLREVKGEEIFYLEKVVGELVPLRKKPAAGTLSSLFSDCADLDELGDRQKRKKYRFTVRSMMENIIAYNECVRPDLENISYKSFDKLAVRPGFRLGFNTTDISLQYPDRALLRQDFSNGYGFLIGAFLNIGPKGRDSFFSVQPELLLTQKRSSASRVCAGGFSCVESVEIKQTSLQVPLLLRLNMYWTAIQFSAVAGPSLDIVLADQSGSFRTDHGQQTQSKFDYVDWSYGFVVGAGIQYRYRYSLEIRLIEGKGVVGGLDEESNEYMLQFTIGFML